MKSRTVATGRIAFVPQLLVGLSVLIALVSSGCHRRATRAECNEMLERYLDMVIRADPSLADLPAAEADAAREMKRALRTGEPDYQRVRGQCEAEVSTSEYRCAMKATAPETWEACID